MGKGEKMLRKDKAINVGLAVVVIVLLVGFSFSVRIRPVADSVALLKRAAIADVGRNADLIKHLQSEKGIASVEADMTGDFLVVGYDSKSVKPEVIVSTVTALGHQYGVAKILTVEQFKAMTGRDPAANARRTCNGGCGEPN